MALNTLQKVIVFFSILTLCTFILALAFTSKDYVGVDVGHPINSTGGSLIRTTKIHLAFGLLGEILGIILCVLALVYVLLKGSSSLFVVVWVLFAGITLFFLCGTIGMMSQLYYLSPADLPPLYDNELAWLVIAAILFIVLLVLVAWLLDRLFNEDASYHSNKKTPSGRKPTPP